MDEAQHKGRRRSRRQATGETPERLSTARPGGRAFKAPGRWLAGVDPHAASDILTTGTDLALLLDGRGIIRDLCIGSEDLLQLVGDQWLGRAWSATVSEDSRPKVDAMLRDARGAVRGRWRQVNHPTGAATLPIVYRTVSVGDDGRVLAVGRDLRSVAELQHRLVEAEQAIERDYSRLRYAETRYRLLFQMSSDAVLIVDAANERIVEANPASAELLGSSVRRLAGRAIADCFEAVSQRALADLLAAARTAGHAEPVKVRAEGATYDWFASASLFRQEQRAFVLVRLDARAGVEAGGTPGAPGVKSRVLDVIESSPDGFVVTDMEGRILTANRAFLELAQLATEEQVRGESLDQWLGRSGVDLGVLIANLRQHGSVRQYATTVRSRFGAVSDVHLSAVAVPGGDPPCLGFTLRGVALRSATEIRTSQGLPRSAQQLTELVGRVSLKDLVRETTDVIEKLCIEAALDLANDNRVSAAEMLGLSRQSLYVKLRRFGLVDGTTEKHAPN
jgi:transcriptional regulator PpsR